MTPRVFPMTLAASLAWLLALLLAFPVLAEEEEKQALAGNLLDSLHQFRLQNFLALNAYYSYSVTPDRERIQEINNAMSRSRRLLERARKQVGDSLSGSSMDELASAFRDFQKQMDTNVADIRESGYPDLRLLSNMAEQAQTLSLLSEKIYQQVASQGRTPTREEVQLAREASITMALMVTRYSARTSSSVSQVFQGADSDRSIDELALRFDELLRQLDLRMNNDGSQDLLARVNSQWEFIRNSYIHYDERNVSFVINRYSLQIIDTMEDLVNRLNNT
ncbi:MAG: hypothetical protein R3296_14100 [Oleiphilaceae bacterium]|nr:hypothetical protein [Oleiphilaceae bacterium]